MMIIDRRHLVVDWLRRPDGRRFKFRHDASARSLYLQIRSLEVVVWYR